MKANRQRLLGWSLAMVWAVAMALVAACAQPQAPANIPEMHATQSPQVGSIVGPTQIGNGNAQTNGGTVDAASPPAPAASAAPAPSANPYHPGDYKMLLPSGSFDLRGADGGAIRIHDGNEHPCDFGCLSLYNTAMAKAAQGGGTVTDTDAVVRDCLACVRACEKAGADKVTWP